MREPGGQLRSRVSGRASISYVEHLIDTCLPNQTVIDMKS